MLLLSSLRWLVYTLFPARCPECSALLAPVLRQTATDLGARVHVRDPRGIQRSDWLCCESCPYAVAFDLLGEEEA